MWRILSKYLFLFENKVNSDPIYDYAAYWKNKTIWFSHLRTKCPNMNLIWVSRYGLNFKQNFFTYSSLLIEF